MKTCTKCGYEKPLSEFYLRGNGYYYSSCKTCEAAKFQERKKTLEYQTQVKRKRGVFLSISELESMIKRQENRCAICGDEFTTLDVDHCHSTGRIRGLLCRRCNLGLGFFRDNPRFLHIAIQYLNLQEKNDYSKENDSGD